jgi:hypothetical protein
MKHGAPGNAHMAGLFGRAPRKRNGPEYARDIANEREQRLAAEALLEIDPDAARTAVRTLAKSKKLTPAQAEALGAVVKKLAGQRGASKVWMETIFDVTRALPDSIVKWGGSAWDDAIGLLITWKHPKAAAEVLARMHLVPEIYGRNGLLMDNVCKLLEAAKDRSVLPALKKRLACTPRGAHHLYDRLAECITRIAN